MGENKPNWTYVIIGLVVLIVVAGVLWGFLVRKLAEPVPEPKAIKTSEDVVEAVTTPELEVGSNPVQNKVPEVNPVDRANPFKDAYQNPFE